MVSDSFNTRNKLDGNHLVSHPETTNRYISDKLCKRILQLLPTFDSKNILFQSYGIIFSFWKLL